MRANLLFFCNWNRNAEPEIPLSLKPTRRYKEGTLYPDFSGDFPGLLCFWRAVCECLHGTNNVSGLRQRAVMAPGVEGFQPSLRTKLG
jgi:hypothetical protein